MLNLTIPPQVNTTPSDPATTVNANTLASNSSENEQFNKILEREMSDKSSNAADKTPASAKESSVEQSNAKVLPQTPENSSKLAQSHSPKKTIFFEIDSSTATLNLEQQFGDEIISPFAPIISALHPINGPISQFSNSLGQNGSFNQLTNSLGKSTGSASLLTSGQLNQQNPSRFILNLNNYSSYGLQSNDVADFATFNQILPSRIDMSHGFLSGTEESAKFSSSELAQPTGINTLSSVTPSTASTTSIPQDLSIGSQITQPKWGGEFAQKIVWLSTQQQQIAEIRLNPAHLGPVEVMLNMSNDQITAQFVSSHLAVREAIEASLPRLREMMSENGITLGDVSVGAESFQQQADTQQNNKESSRNGYGNNTVGLNDEPMAKIETSIALNRHNGIVNTFA